MMKYNLEFFFSFSDVLSYASRVALEMPPSVACRSFSIVMVQGQLCVWRLLALSAVGALQVQQHRLSGGESLGPRGTGDICALGSPFQHRNRGGTAQSRA